MVNINFPFDEVTRNTIESAAGRQGSCFMLGDVECMSFYHLQENEANEIIARVLDLGLEGVTANIFEDDYDFDSGDDW